MADEIQILTTSADGSTWADVVPNAVSTGYQAQNTNIDAIRNGEDRSSITYDSGSAEIVLSPSGVIDVNGLPFVIKTETRLPISTDGDYYIKIIAGTGSTLRSAELSSSRGKWDASKNAFYDSGLRVLNWLINKTGDDVTIYRLVEENQINGSAKRPEYPWGFVRRGDLPEWLYWQVVTDEYTNLGGSTEFAVDRANNNLISVSSSLNRIYIHDGITGSVISSFASPASSPSGIEIDESTGNLISSDFVAQRIYVHSGITSSLITNFASPATQPLGITIDTSTGNLISTDRLTDTIYVHSGITSTIITSFLAPELDPGGLTYDRDNKNLISAYSGSASTQSAICLHYGTSFALKEKILGPGNGGSAIAYYNKCLIIQNSKIEIRGYLQ